MTRSLRRPLALLALLAALAAACGGDETAGEATTLRLGCFPNVTHAPALVGIQEGFFAEALGSDVELELSYFNAGPEAVESLFGEALDATFIGPNPAINALRAVRRRGHPHHRRLHVGRRLLGRSAGHRVGRGSRRHHPRHPAAGQHPGRGAARLADRTGSLRRHRRRRGCVDRPAVERRHPAGVPGRGHRWRLGARALGHPAHPRGRRDDPHRRTRPVARRPLRDHSPDRAHRVPRAEPHPDRSTCSRGTSRRCASSTRTPQRHRPSPTTPSRPSPALACPTR